MKTLGRSVVGSIAAGFAMLVVAGAATAWLVVRVQDETALVSHSLQVELALSNLRAQSEQLEAARRGFLLNPDERFATIVDRLISEIAPRTDQLRRLVGDNPDQAARVTRLADTSASHIDAVERSIDERRALPPDTLPEFVYAVSTQSVLDVRRLSDEISAAERALLQERITQQEASQRFAYGLIAFAFLLLVLVAAGTIWATRRNMLTLRRTTEELARLNDDLEGAVTTRTSDLQRANDEIQRFAYIVSHDLRSPLVNVMGFTSELEATNGMLGDFLEKVETEAPQLVTGDTRLAVREDLPEAIGFIRSSTQKMDRLINAILRLSREGRRVIAPEPLDMNEVLAGIVASLQHRLAETGSEIRVEPLPRLVSDRVGVEQVFSNLLENAIKYRKADRPCVVKVAGRREGSRAVFEVSDNGRGIDPKDHDRIFDLFRRSGRQDQPGEGIGLAHVRATVYRLGGVITCRSALDEGATFRLSMRTDMTDEGVKAL